MPGRVMLGVLSAAAGVIHLVMVPSHAGEWLPEGIAFATAGWLQLALAVVIVARGPRWAILLSCVTNALFIGAWAVSRIWGWPIGPEVGVVQSVSVVDVTCVAFEGVAVLVAGVLLVRPQVGARWSSATLAVLSAAPVAVVALASVAIASPSAMDHAHAGGDGSEEAHLHESGALGAEADAHDHDTAVTYQTLDAASQRDLSSQLALAREATMQYPTVADFTAMGGQRIGFFAPGSGAHYGFPMGATGMDRLTFDPAKPLMLLYAGNDDTSPVVGAMYLTLVGDVAPEGFAGPNDEWHRHTGACMGDASAEALEFVLPIDQDVTQEQCAAAGGAFIDVTPWMVHVWTAPGWESPEGVFSHDNPLLVCRDGNTDAAGDFGKGCKGLP